MSRSQIMLGVVVSVGVIAFLNFEDHVKPIQYVDPASLDAEKIGAIVEPKAQISPLESMTNEQLAFMVGRVRNSGYKCDSISYAGISGVSDIGVRLRCDHWTHSYDMHDRGGTWVVTLDD